MFHQLVYLQVYLLRIGTCHLRNKGHCAIVTVYPTVGCIAFRSQLATCYIAQAEFYTIGQ